MIWDLLPNLSTGSWCVCPLPLYGELTKPFPAKRCKEGHQTRRPYVSLSVCPGHGVLREFKQLATYGDFNYHPRCTKLNTTHICLADDLLIYCGAGLLSVKLRHGAFLKFPKASGLQANTDNCSIYIAGVADHTRQEIFNELGYALHIAI